MEIKYDPMERRFRPIWCIAKIQFISFAASPFRWKLPCDVIMIRFDEPIEQMDGAVTRQTLTLIESRLRTNNNEEKKSNHMVGLECR